MQATNPLADPCYKAADQTKVPHSMPPTIDDFPVAPPIVIKDTPKPRRLTTLKEARAYVDEAMRLGHRQPWREVWQRLKAVKAEDEAIEAIGDLRELLADEDLLLPSGGPT